MRRWRASPGCRCGPTRAPGSPRCCRQGRLLETPDCPVATIEQASVWADCIKPLGDRFSYAYSWHYQNVDVCKPFDLKAAVQGRQLRVGADRARRATGGRPERPDPRAADGARLPDPFRRRPPPADACRRSWRPWRQQGRGQLWRDRRARPIFTASGTAGWPSGRSPRRRAVPPAMLASTIAGRP